MAPIQRPNRSSAQPLQSQGLRKYKEDKQTTNRPLSDRRQIANPRTMTTQIEYAINSIPVMVRNQTCSKF